MPCSMIIRPVMMRSTLSALYFMYEEGFRWWNLGNASAVAFLLFVVIFSVSWMLTRLDKRDFGTENKETR